MPNHLTIFALINSTLMTLAVAIPALASDTEQMIRDAVAHHDQGEYQQAIELLEQVVELEPDNGFAAYELAYSHQANGDLEACARIAGKGMRKIRRDEEQEMLMPQLAMMQASCLSAAGKSRKAIKTFKDALKDNPDDFWLNFNIAITLLKTDQIDDAISHLQSAVRVDPYHPSPWYVLGGAYYEQQQSVDAVLAYINFLQREFNTERCVNASRWLIDLLYSTVRNDTASGEMTILLPPPSAGGSPDSMALNLALSLSALASPPDNDAEGPMSDSIAEVITSFIGIASELELESDPDSFLAEHLMSGVRGIDGENVGTAFAYFLLSVAGIEGANQWLDSHVDETDALVSYFGSRSMQDEPERQD